VLSLDTNVVLRFLLNDVDAQSTKATEIIETKQVYVTDVVVAETIFVLEKSLQLRREDVVKLVGGFLGLANVTHNPYFLTDAIQLYKNKPALSIADCYASAEAKAYKNTLTTFDRKLANQGGRHVVTL